MTTKLKQFGQRVVRYARKQLRLPATVSLDEPTRRFVAHNRRKWGSKSAATGNAVVLVGLFAHRPSIYCYSYALNNLAQRTGAKIETYQFGGRRNLGLERVYESFGAKLGLSFADAEAFRARSAERANEIFSALKSRWDVLAIREEDIRIGDLIYDSYMRYHEQPTVHLDDPRLRDVIQDALLILYTTSDYMRRKRVTAFVTDDYGYNSCGVPTRVAMREKVPVYLICPGPQFFIYELFGEADTGWHDYPIRWPYHHYKTQFAQMAPEEQGRCREVGRNHLEGKLNGVIDRFTLQTITAYGNANGRIFGPKTKPRILVLLHDFVDAPHGYRHMLFPDFMDWIQFLFDRAGETDFEWYMKPHPGAWDIDKRQINRANQQTVSDLRAKYPHIHYLDPSVSNRQLIEEGLTAMFTVYGTAGHEFAYLGVPVVNAGDNPHIAYDFNFHPKSIEEFADYIRRADQLKIDANKDEIAEFFYMNNFYYPDNHSSAANPIPARFYESADASATLLPSTGYDLLVAAETPERDAELEQYFDKCFARLPKAAAAH